ncbi:hypothetical protein P5V15_013814 [Pogonomyrmex californicus]
MHHGYLVSNEKMSRVHESYWQQEREEKHSDPLVRSRGKRRSFLSFQANGNTVGFLKIHFKSVGGDETTPPSRETRNIHTSTYLYSSESRDNSVQVSEKSSTNVQQEYKLNIRQVVYRKGNLSSKFY